MKKAILEFTKLYIKSYFNLNMIISLIKKDINYNYYYNSDEQLMDISYEYDCIKNINSYNIRFSYFWTNISFLKSLDNYLTTKDLVLEYNKYIEYIKNDFITLSFSFTGNIIENIKIYFDVYWKKIPTNIIPLNNNIIDDIILLSFTWNKKWIIEKKVYLPFNKYNYYYSRLLLQKNYIFSFYKKYIPFDILFREQKWKLCSIKYYYKYNDINKELFSYIIRKYFSNIKEKESTLNLQYEIWIDFNLIKWINKINYYIWLYK